MTMSDPVRVPLPSSPSSPPLSHLDIEFDSGINTSAAWTVSLSPPTDQNTRAALEHSAIACLSDEEADDIDSHERNALDDGQETERPARVLYAFEGKPEFRELTNIAAGDELMVIREDVGEGWSLVRLVRGANGAERDDAGEMGLLPRSYYIVSKNIRT